MGKWKMMLPWQGGTILDASIKNALQFCHRVILVTGYRASELQSRYANQRNIIITYNPNYAQGLYSSINVAATAVRSEHCFITHGDMPEVHVDIFRKIWALRDENAIIPCYKGQPGHPILLSRKCLMQAISGPDVNTMRAALLRGKHRIVEINDPRITLDIDTPEDFFHAQNRQP